MSVRAFLFRGTHRVIKPYLLAMCWRCELYNSTILSSGPHCPFNITRRNHLGPSDTKSKTHQQRTLGTTRLRSYNTPTSPKWSSYQYLLTLKFVHVTIPAKLFHVFHLVCTSSVHISNLAAPMWKTTRDELNLCIEKNNIRFIRISQRRNNVGTKHLRRHLCGSAVPAHLFVERNWILNNKEAVV
jgi:hypothetical protein